MKLFKIDKEDAEDTLTTVEFVDGFGSEEILTKVPVSDFTPQPLNKCCISCGGYTLNLGEDYYPHTEHSRKFCFMCLFGGKADE